MNSSKTGVLLLNLGTPNSPSTADVRKYLNQFLYDPRVIELPTLLRWLLVKCIIVPFRAAKSAAAYKKIWQAAGSPLLINSMQIKDNLAELLGSKYAVVLGMRYGNPSISAAIAQLQQQDIDKIIVLPLFPQYSSAATGSALEEALQIIAKFKIIPQLEVKPEYFQQPGFIACLAESIKPYIESDFDYLLMSYHGLPEQQMEHSKNTACDMQQPCPQINSNNSNCYRAQCYQTSRLLAQNLNLSAEQWGIGFQSRLGRLPWIKPYSDEVLVKLRQQGLRKLVVCCPSFVADCLETLEEIGIMASEQWLSLGGESLRLVPCLNARRNWIELLANMINKTALVSVNARTCTTT